MDFNKFKIHFHSSWHSKIKPFIESEECDKIYAFLKAESKKGVKVAPISMHLWKCFKETPLNEVKVIMMGISPYSGFKDDAPIADGLLLGCSITEQLHPSLHRFYNAIEKEFYDGFNLDYVKNTNVDYLTEQGVLMLNASLTTEMDKEGAHLEIWEPFIKYLFKHILNDLGVPIIFIGKESAKCKQYTTSLSHTFELKDLNSDSYGFVEWDTEGVFTKVNELLYETNGFNVEWLDTDVPF